MIYVRVAPVAAAVLKGIQQPSQSRCAYSHPSGKAECPHLTTEAPAVRQEPVAKLMDELVSLSLWPSGFLPSRLGRGIALGQSFQKGEEASRTKYEVWTRAVTSSGCLQDCPHLCLHLSPPF